MDLLRWYKGRHEGLQPHRMPLEAWDRQFYMAMARVRLQVIRLGFWNLLYSLSAKPAVYTL